MFKDFLNVPMGRLITVEALPHYQCCLTFQSASQGNVTMILNSEDLEKFTNMLLKARTDMSIANDIEEDEEAV
jgi:hypothetical protein